MNELMETTAERFEEIRNLLAATDTVMRTVVFPNIIKIGQQLIAAKEEVPRGQWLNVLKDELGWEEDRRAQDFMRVAANVAQIKYAQGPAHIAYAQIPFDFSNLQMSKDAIFHLFRKHVPQDVRDEALRRAAEGEKITKAKIDEMMAKAREEGRKAGKDEAGADARAEAEKAKAAAQEAILKAREKAVADFQSKLDDLANQLSSKQKEIDKLKVQGSATAAQRKQLEEQLELVEKAKRRAERDMRKAERELEELKARGGHIEVFAMKYQQDVIGLYTNLVNLEPLTKAIMENQDQLPPDRIKAITDYFNKISKLAADYASNMRTETGKVITIDSRRK